MRSRYSFETAAHEARRPERAPILTSSRRGEGRRDTAGGGASSSSTQGIPRLAELRERLRQDGESGVGSEGEGESEAYDVFKSQARSLANFEIASPGNDPTSKIDIGQNDISFLTTAGAGVRMIHYPPPGAAKIASKSRFRIWTWKGGEKYEEEEWLVARRGDANALQQALHDLYAAAIGIHGGDSVLLVPPPGFWEEEGLTSDLREVQERPSMSGTWKLRRAGWGGRASVRWPPWRLLEPDVDDGGANAEKRCSNLVRGRAVAYANSGEDETVKSYDVGEAAVWCPDWPLTRAAPRTWFRGRIDASVLECLCPRRCLAVEEAGRAAVAGCGGLGGVPSGGGGTKKLGLGGGVGVGGAGVVEGGVRAGWKWAEVKE
ncbi:hypothetical protein B0H14DRAFT_2596750 [Mycena olivaceomarginata]|nr:hypothetical protein B0H14DRAFT_2596750 [Mycena olivaceomarginata]